MAELVPERPTNPKPLKDSYKIGSEFSPKLIAPIEAGYLEKGDEFTIPTFFEIRIATIGEKMVEFIEVQLKNGKSKPLYPSIFVRPRTIYNEDGTSTGKRVRAKGTASELVFQSGDLHKGMELLKGKTLRVTDIEYIRTMRYNTATLMMTAIPTIDIIE